MNKKLILHVALNGCDGWSGLLPYPNEDGTDGPLNSLAMARDRIRSIRACGKLNNLVEVHIHEGLHEIKETFFLSEEDMGDVDSLVKYMSAGDGEVILTGSKQLTGFEPAGNGVYKLDLASIGLKGLTFGQLFCNGKRQILSRYPNFDPQYPYGGGWLYVEGDVPEDVMGLYEKGKGVKDRFICTNERLKNWKNIEEAEIFIFPRFNWNSDILKIKSYDVKTGEIVLDRPAIYEIYAGDRFYFRNVAEELDTPGEWYLDKENNILYFHPPVDINDAIITVPIIENIITIDGWPIKYRSYNEELESQGRDLFHWQDPDSVKHGYISFENLTIEGCDGIGILIRGAKGCTAEGCTVRNTGKFGIRILGGAECRISDCDVYETGHDGIFVRGGRRDDHDLNYIGAKHEVRNNYIHHVGIFDKCVAGVRIDGTGNIAANNLIHDAPRWGIISGGNDNVIEYNHIRHVNLETSDTGAIYFCNRNFKMRGNKIKCNLIHDVFGHHLLNGKWLPPVITYGIYLDDYTSGTEITHNITYRTPKGGIMIHDGQDNVVENNMFLETYSEAATFVRSNPDRELHMMGTYSQAVRRNTLSRNIISSSLDTSIAYFLDNCFNDEGTIDFDTNIVENNLIWLYGRDVMVETCFYSKLITWEKWLERGYEKGTIIADPKFKNALADDFRLEDDSPAFNLGFEPISVEKIGPYKSELRNVWPIVEAEGIREHPQEMENPDKM